ncbi:MAG TPA: hypothetical protein VGH27_25780 [Streptosporangiaceae bacterium]|jgi:hypothetical protein
MPPQRLFGGPGIATIRSMAIVGASPHVRRFTDDQLSSDSPAVLAQYVADQIMGQPVSLDTADHQIDPRIVPLREPDDSAVDPSSAPDDTPSAMDAIQLSLHIPYSGTATIFKTQPSHAPSTPVPEATLTDHEVIITVTGKPGEDGQEVEGRLLLLERHLQQWVEAVNSDVVSLKGEVKVRARELVDQRVSVRRHRDDIVAALTIPLRQVNPGRALEVPTQRKAVLPKTSSAGSPSEFALSGAVYEQIIRTILGFTHALERRPASAHSLIADEETMRDWVMFLLSANYETPDGTELFIGGETENGKGKTDILVRYRNRNAFIGECKFWDGPAKFDTAIDQLLSYTVWRDTKAALILFITKQNPTRVIGKAHARLTTHMAHRRTLEPADPGTRRDYRFISPADNRRTISLALLPVVVPRG